MEASVINIEDIISWEEISMEKTYDLTTDNNSNYYLATKNLPILVHNSGKTTLAELLYKELIGRGIKAAHLDGDKIREVFPQTGFTKSERHDHICRIGYTASILEAHGITVVCSFISPYKASRNFVRTVCKDYKEIYVTTPLWICEGRDPKGLYKKAREGKILNFTGIDDPYEKPENPFMKMGCRHEAYENISLILEKLKLS